LNLKPIRTKLIAQGAILNDGSVISEIAANLVFKMWTATPGAGVYRTDRYEVYRLELDSRYQAFTAEQFQIGLPMYDERVVYMRHWFDAKENRVMVHFEVKE
jgi:hypothetical protein